MIFSYSVRIAPERGIRLKERQDSRFPKINRALANYLVENEKDKKFNKVRVNQRMTPNNPVTIKKSTCGRAGNGLGAGVAIGAAIGAAIGSASGNMGMSVAMGVALGTALGSAFDFRKRNCACTDESCSAAGVE